MHGGGSAPSCRGPEWKKPEDGKTRTQRCPRTGKSKQTKGEQAAGGGCRRQPGILTLTLQSPSQIPYQPSQGCSVGEARSTASHRAGPTRAGTLGAPAQGSATPFPSRGSPSLPPFRNPVFYLSCLSGLGYNRGDSSPSSRPRAGPKQPSSQQRQPCFLFPHQHTSITRLSEAPWQVP